MQEKPKYCVMWSRKETVLESWANDAVTFGLLIVAIYASRGHGVWTFITSTMWVVWLIASAFKVVDRRKKNEFHSKEEVREWLDSLD